MGPVRQKFAGPQSAAQRHLGEAILLDVPGKGEVHFCSLLHRPAAIWYRLFRMAKGLRSKVKVRSRNIKRTDPNSDFVKVQQQRDADIAAHLAERKQQLKTSDLERLQDIKERKEAGQEITEEEQVFLQNEGKVAQQQNTEDGTQHFPCCFPHDIEGELTRRDRSHDCGRGQRCPYNVRVSVQVAQEICFQEGQEGCT